MCYVTVYATLGEGGRGRMCPAPGILPVTACSTTAMQIGRVSPMPTAFQPCPGVASLVLSHDIGENDPTENVLHFQKNDLTAWSPSELMSLCNSFDTWLGTANGIAAFLAGLHTSFQIVQLAARDFTVDGGAEYIKTVSHSGTDAAAQLQAGLSFAFTLRTGLSGRSFRGRIFYARLTTSWLPSSGANEVEASKADPIVVGLTNLITAAAGWSPAMKWVVLSRRHKVLDVPNVIRETGIGTPITEVGYSNLTVDFQRRRAPFHGRRL